MLRKCVSYHKNPHLSNPFTKPSHTNQPSSAALMAHPTPGNPLNPPALINPTLPPEAPHSHHYLPPGIEQPGRRVPVCYDSAGGELILGWRKSALFLKSPLSERQQAASSDFLKTVLAEFRQPRSSPRRSPEQIGTRLPGVRHPPSTIHHKKRALPQPIQPTKNALLISISLQSYTITYDQHTIPYDRIKYNS